MHKSVPPPDKPNKRDFRDGPWAQKKMAGSDKKLATEAAERAHMTLPQWLALAIREKVARERGALGLAHEGEVLPPDASPGAASRSALTLIETPPPLSMNEVGLAIEYAFRLMQVRGLKHPPKAITAAAQRVIEARLKASLGVTDP